jgi:hypothetical protein
MFNLQDCNLHNENCNGDDFFSKRPIVDTLYAYLTITSESHLTYLGISSRGLKGIVYVYLRSEESHLNVYLIIRILIQW